MAVRAFGPDGKEIDLKAGRRAPRVLNPFEQGFHSAALGNAIIDNPFPPNTTAEEDWCNGWKVFKDRKQKYHWMIKGQLPPENVDGPKLTFLCLVQDHDGYFQHQPCDPKYKGWELNLVWVDFAGRVANVIEFAVVPMKNPRFVNAMQANPNWNPKSDDDI